MSCALHMTGATGEHHPLKDVFLGWQCRVRRQLMRMRGGKPDASITPDLYLPGDCAPMGRIVTVLPRLASFSKVKEFQHLARRTRDTAEWRQRAIALLSETYYGRPQVFSDRLTATFQPGSDGAAAIVEAGGCRLVFSAFSQRFDLDCRVQRLRRGDHFHSATWWHNRLFNPNLLPDIVILGFTPNWDLSSADPPPAGF